MRPSNKKKTLKTNQNALKDPIPNDRRGKLIANPEKGGYDIFVFFLIERNILLMNKYY